MAHLDLRNSHQWIKYLKSRGHQFEIIDPDGWDRTRYESSMNEGILKEEFFRRLSASTIGWKGDVEVIFRDEDLTRPGLQLDAPKYAHPMTLRECMEAEEKPQ